MRIFKSHPIGSIANGYLVDSPQPSNLSYSWNYGSLLGFCLIIQIITGVTLAMHYNPNVLEAFNSVEHIMRDVNSGWLIRYLHSNTASAFFFLVYMHIGRGLYYGSYRAPRTLVWTIGTTILILMMATAFLGYVLPYGQMSLWGATVITNLMSAIPWVGQDIVEFLWGGFSVNNATLNRFFALHFVLPFLLAALAAMHLIALHDSAGSGNPLGVSGNYDKLPFAPYFIFKDLITIYLFIIVLSIFVFFMPNLLGDSENYVMANPMQTPPAIVPEWYLLPFYAILRSIPNKFLGVIAMFSAILILISMPFTDMSRSRGLQFRPISKLAFFVFVANFLILMQLGAKHVESPFIELGQVSTVLYFLHFLILVPVISLFENSLVNVNDKLLNEWSNNKKVKWAKRYEKWLLFYAYTFLEVQKITTVLSSIYPIIFILYFLVLCILYINPDTISNYIVYMFEGQGPSLPPGFNGGNLPNPGPGPGDGICFHHVYKHDDMRCDDFMNKEPFQPRKKLTFDYKYPNGSSAFLNKEGKIYPELRTEEYLKVSDSNNNTVCEHSHTLFSDENNNTRKSVWTSYYELRYFPDVRKCTQEIVVDHVNQVYVYNHEHLDHVAKPVSCISLKTKSPLHWANIVRASNNAFVADGTHHTRPNV